jgi:hypothetical protein
LCSPASRLIAAMLVPSPGAGEDERLDVGIAVLASHLVSRGQQAPISARSADRC